MSNVRRAAVIAATLLVGVSLFQLALAAGVAWGDMSYGGQAETVDGVLPGSYRSMSAAAVLILIFAAFIVLARAGVVGSFGFSNRFLRVATWVVFGYLALNTVMNLMSSHNGERFGMGAVTVISAICCYIVARSPEEAIAAGPSASRSV